jgi:hypothetical protein
VATLPHFPPTRQINHVADLTIEALAHDEVLLRERLADILSEREWYREIAQVALGEVARLTGDLRQARAACSALRAELRQERAR